MAPTSIAATPEKTVRRMYMKWKKQAGRLMLAFIVLCLPLGTQPAAAARMGSTHGTPALKAVQLALSLSSGSTIPAGQVVTLSVRMSRPVSRGSIVVTTSDAPAALSRIPCTPIVGVCRIALATRARRTLLIAALWPGDATTGPATAFAAFRVVQSTGAMTAEVAGRITALTVFGAVPPTGARATSLSVSITAPQGSHRECTDRAARLYTASNMPNDYLVHSPGTHACTPLWYLLPHLPLFAVPARLDVSLGGTVAITSTGVFTAPWPVAVSVVPTMAGSHPLAVQPRFVGRALKFALSRAMTVGIYAVKIDYFDRLVGLDAATTTASFIHAFVPILVSPQTRVLTAQSIASLQPLAGSGPLALQAPSATLVYTNADTQVQALKVGNILVAGITPATPAGMLRKVTGISTQGTRISLSTTRASLSDVITQGSFQVTVPFNTQQPLPAAPPVPSTTGAAALPTAEGTDRVGRAGALYAPLAMPAGVTAVRAASSGSGEVSNPCLAPQTQPIKADTGPLAFAMGPQGVNAEVCADGSFTVSAQWGPSYTPEVTYVLSGTQSAFLQLTPITGTVTLEHEIPIPLGDKGQEEDLPTEIQLPTLEFLIGYIPVVITQSLGIGISLDASVSAGMAATANESVQLEAGIRCVGSACSPLPTCSNRQAFNPAPCQSVTWQPSLASPPTFNGSADVVLALVPKYEAKFYDLGGPTLAVAAYGEVIVSSGSTPNPSLQVNVGVKGELSCDLSLFNVSCGTLDLFNFAWNVYSNSGQTQVYPPPLNLSSGGTLAIPRPPGDYPLQLCSQAGCRYYSITLDVRTTTDGRTVTVTSVTPGGTYSSPVTNIALTYAGCSPMQGPMVVCGFDATVTMNLFGHVNVSKHGLRYQIGADGSGYNVSSW